MCHGTMPFGHDSAAYTLRMPPPVQLPSPSAPGPYPGASASRRCSRMPQPQQWLGSRTPSARSASSLNSWGSAARSVGLTVGREEDGLPPLPPAAVATRRRAAVAVTGTSRQAASPLLDGKEAVRKVEEAKDGGDREAVGPAEVRQQLQLLPCDRGWRVAEPRGSAGKRSGVRLARWSGAAVRPLVLQTEAEEHGCELKAAASRPAAAERMEQVVTRDC